MKKLGIIRRAFLMRNKDGKMYLVIDKFLKDFSHTKLEGEDLQKYLAYHRSLLVFLYLKKYKEEYSGDVWKIFEKFTQA